MSVAGIGTDAIRHLYRTNPLPMPPWHLEIGVLPALGIGATSGNFAGLAIRDSGSQRLIFFEIGSALGGGALMVLNKYFSYGVASAPYVSLSSPGVYGPVVWLRLDDDGTNYTWSTSVDRQNWVTAFKAARTDWLASPANQVGIAINQFDTNVVSGGLFVHWAGI